MTSITAVASYGRGAGSARVRVYDWLDNARLDARIVPYVDRASNSAAALLRDPCRSIAAERRLRELRDEVGGGTVMISRQASPFSSGAIEEGLLRAAQRGVYDFDDALYLPSGGRAARIFPKSKIWRRSVSSADMVIAGNEVLAEHAESLNSSTIVIPSCVEPRDYGRKNDYETRDTPRAVWIGSPSTESYLSLIAGPLLRANALHGLRLTVISAGAASFGSLDQMVDRVEWRLESFGRELAAADFGLMPLVDNEWSRGKCAYKLLQYGAAGLPMIGSPVGANREVLSRGDGLAPVSDDEWDNAIETLIGAGVKEREQRGKAAFDVVSTRYSFDAWRGTWLAAVGAN